MIYILGIHDGHNATACVAKDGKIIACVSEERINRIKNYLGYPKRAIELCVELAKISAEDYEFTARQFIDKYLK